MHMRILHIFLLMGLALSSCGQPSSSSRFGFTRLSLTVYHWSGYYIITEGDTTPRFHVRRHIEITGSGICRIARRDQFLDSLYFLQANVPSKYDSILVGCEVGARDTTYEPPYTGALGDEGPNCCVSLERPDGTVTMVKYHPGDLPPRLRAVHEVLDSLAAGSQGSRIQAFDYLDVAMRVARSDSLLIRSLPKLTQGAPVSISE